MLPRGDESLAKLVLWVTGLSGAGKSTLSMTLAGRLQAQGLTSAILDGDILRRGLCSDLGFTDQDRSEQARRTCEAALLISPFVDVVICAVISPFSADRQSARLRCANAGVGFLEVYVSTPLQVCEQRDPKGLYQKARSGLIQGFTGLDSPFEPPLMPDLEIKAHLEGVDESVAKLEQVVLRSLRSSPRE